MNWAYLGTAALLPLIVALGLTLAAGAFQALRLNRAGGSSRAAWARLARTLAWVFPLAFLLASAWDGRRTLRGLAGVALGRPADQRAMGYLRSHGKRFLAKNPAKAAHWFLKAANGGDAEAQYLSARVLLRGDGVPPDATEALRWAQTAADHGHPEAMVLTGDLLRTTNLEAAEARYRQALSIFQERALQGEAEAALAHGLLLTQGKGTAKDSVEGLAWMLLARRRGIDPFKNVLIQFSESGLTKAQRAEAAQRATALQQKLAAPTAGKS
jgi:hypothetical protein